MAPEIPPQVTPAAGHLARRIDPSQWFGTSALGQIELLPSTWTPISIPPVDAGAPRVSDCVIVDYELGNTLSVLHALRRVGVAARVSRDPADVSFAQALVLPGVGAFAKAMENLDRLGLTLPLRRAVEERRTPILGICLGMQIMGKSSTEHGHHDGLGWFDYEIRRLQPAGGLPVPHVGWNSVATLPEAIVEGVPEGASFYFDHGYAAPSRQRPYEIATCDYGESFVALARREHVFAAQFHPEKSQDAGQKLLANFADIVASTL